MAKRHSEAIAIVGMACRFPQANNTAEFWELLARAGDAVTEIPASRFDIDEYYDEDPAKLGKICTRYGGFLDQVDQFDPAFFGIPPRAAKSMDPQQRLILEVSWEALEHANIPPVSLKNTRSGVFIGVSEVDYAEQAFADLAKVDIYAGTGNGQAFVSGRLAYILGLNGPAKSIDTACSSSLVAVHDACQSLRSGETELAIVGGTHLILNPNNYIFLTRSKSLSPDGRCKTFDAKANGFARAEGCGVVILKRLSEAQKAGDNVLAVIRGSAVNNDGPSGGLTMPNADAQASLIHTALSNSGLQPNQIRYLETFGTGTMLGDPIELLGAGKVFADDPLRPVEQPLYLGSVKSNIGHCEPAAGIAGLIKVVLAMQANCLPKQALFEQANPKAAWEKLPFQVVSENTDWPTEEQIAGVSSFGLSGTNAHVIVEGLSQTDDSSACHDPYPFHLLSLSAKTPKALSAQAQQYADFLAVPSDISFPDICYSAAVGRQHFPYRLSVVARDAEEARQQLLALGDDENQLMYQHKALRKPPGIAFLFTGQGAQYSDMGYGLYQSDTVFRESMQACDRLLRTLLGYSVLDTLYECRGQDEASHPVHHPQYAQPALFAVEYALAKLWLSWGVTPTILVGHNLGEFVAACIAGVFSLEDALILVVHRARLMGAPDSDKAFARLTETIDFHAPQYEIMSNFGGSAIGEEITNTDYWVQHIQQSDRVAESIQLLQQKKLPVFVEIGPQPNLLDIAAQSEPKQSKRQLLPSIRRGHSNWQTLLNSVGALYQLGVAIDWAQLYSSQCPNKVCLPSYPFQRQRYWVEASAPKKARSLLPLIDKMTTLPRHREVVFETAFSAAALSYLSDQKIYGELVSPAACQLAMVVNGTKLALNIKSTVTLKAVELPQAILIPPEQCRQVQASFARSQQTPEAGYAFTVTSVVGESGLDVLDQSDFITHAKGRVETSALLGKAQANLDIAQLRIEHTAPVDLDQLYRQNSLLQLEPEGSFCWLAGLWMDDASEPKRLLASLKLPKGLALIDYALHPGLLGACFQVAMAAECTADHVITQLPSSIASLVVHKAASGSDWWCHATQNAQGEWDMVLADSQGKIIVKVESLALREADLSIQPRLNANVHCLAEADIDCADTQQAALEGSFSDRLKQASEVERKRLLQETIREQVACIMEVADARQIDLQQSLLKQGMDSLMTIELTNAMSKVLGVTLGSTLVFNHPSIEKLAELLLSEVFGKEQGSSLDLTRVPRTPAMALSFTQQRFWEHQATDPQGCFHNIVWLLRVEGPLNKVWLQQGLDTLVERHEILRTTFPMSGGEAVAVVGNANRLDLNTVDLEGRSAAGQEAETHKLLQLEVQQRYFDLANGPLTRATLVKLADETHLLLLCQHHIITNFPSLVALTREWYALYDALARGEVAPLEKPTLQYLDYAAWQSRSLTGKALKARQDYWKKWLGPKKPALLELPTDRPRKHPTYQAETLQYQYSAALTSSVKQLNQRLEGSSYACVMTALSILLSRYSGSDDIVIGSPFSTNWGAGDRDVMLGAFGGLLQLRIDLSGRPDFSTLLSQVGESVQQAMAFQDIPLQQFEKLIGSNKPTQTAPFFRVMFNFFPEGAPGNAVDELNRLYPDASIKLQLEQPEQVENRPDLTLQMYEDKQRAEPVLKGIWRYRTDLFDKETVVAISEDLQHLLEVICAQPDQLIHQLPFQPSLKPNALPEVQYA